MRPSGRTLALVALWLCLASALAILQSGRETATVFADEWVWGRLAQNLANGDGFTYRGFESTFRSIAPFLQAIPWTVSSGTTAYHAALVINAFTMAAVAFPGYAIARRATSHRWALAAAAACALTPGMVWAGMLMTEALAYPAAALSLLFILRALERPGLPRTGVALASVGLAGMIRSQLFVLGIVLFLALALDAIRRGADDRRMHDASLATLATVGVAAAVGAAMGAGGLALGAYEDALSGLGNAGDLATFALDYIGVISVSALGLPLVALLALGSRRDLWTSNLGPLLALAVASTLAFLAIGAWASATVSPELRERYVFYALPPLAACLVALPGRATPRRVLVSAAGVAAVIVLTFPGFEDVTDDAVRDAIGSLLENSVGSDLGLPSLVGGQAELFGVAIAVLGAAGALGLRLAGRAGAAALLVPTLLFGASVLAVRQREANRESRERAASMRQPLDWIDRMADGPVATVRLRGAEPIDLYELELWNERLDRGFVLDADTSGEVGGFCRLTRRTDGTLVLATSCPGGRVPRYLLFVGSRTVRSVQPARLLGTGARGERLYVLEGSGPPRVQLGA